MSEYPYLKVVPIVRDILDCWSVEEVMGNFTPHGPSESETVFHTDIPINLTSNQKLRFRM